MIGSSLFSNADINLSISSISFPSTASIFIIDILFEYQYFNSVTIYDYLNITFVIQIIIDEY